MHTLYTKPKFRCLTSYLNSTSALDLCCV